MSSEPGTIIAAAWILVGIVWLIGLFGTKQTVRSQSLASRLLDMAPLIIGVILLRDSSSVAHFLAARFVPDALEWKYAGAAVTVVGILFAIWSRFYIGGNWSANVTVKQGHQLIRTGPYGLVRHPIYSGFLLAVLGTAIYVGALRGLFAFALILLGWKIKIRREESFMQAEFGQQYTEYRHAVKGLVPFIW